MRFLFGILLVLSGTVQAAPHFVDMVRQVHKEIVEQCSQKAVTSVVLQNDWKDITSAAGLTHPVTFVVADCGTIAQAMFLVDTIIVTPDLAEFPREVRYTVLAHELGHILNKDVTEWTKWEMTYAEALSASHVSSTLEAAYSHVSHTREYSADQFATRVLSKLGYSAARGLAWLQHESGISPDRFEETNTHPAMQARIAKITP